jgi:hypothetical protein
MKKSLLSTIEGQTYFFDEKARLFYVQDRAKFAPAPQLYVGSINSANNSLFRGCYELSPDRVYSMLPSRAQIEENIGEVAFSTAVKHGACWLDTIEGATHNFVRGNYLLWVDPSHLEDIAVGEGLNGPTIELWGTPNLYVGERIERMHGAVSATELFAKTPAAQSSLSVAA